MTFKIPSLKYPLPLFRALFGIYHLKPQARIVLWEAGWTTPFVPQREKVEGMDTQDAFPGTRTSLVLSPWPQIRPPYRCMSKDPVLAILTLNLSLF